MPLIRGETSRFHVQLFPQTRAIRLIGYSFHFHVAHLFKRELEMLQSVKMETLRFKYDSFKLENV